MNSDNPFFDNEDSDLDRTVVRPSPGGNRLRNEPAPRPRPQGRASPHYQVDYGLNPLVLAASPLLALVSKLHSTSAHNQVDQLRAQVEQEVTLFESRASAQVDQETIHASRYCLCCVLDEAVLNTPWGAQSNWSRQSLLISLHQESWGGEKFFIILERLMKNPAQHIDMLELMYLCLSLGFEGKYRVLEGGRRQLEKLCDTLFQLIRQQRGDPDPQLSPQWQGEQRAASDIRRFVPLWVIALVSGALLTAIYLTFTLSINQASTPLFKHLYTLGREEPPAAVIAEAAPPPPPPEYSLYQRVTQFLQQELAQGKLEVIDASTNVTIRLRNTGLFGSGSATINPDYEPLLARIADTLSIAEGRITIAGHSDNVPIHTLKFPSNWHLSKARADAVAVYIQQLSIIPPVITTEGRADNEPLVDNDSAANRAINRRVEIILEK